MGKKGGGSAPAPDYSQMAAATEKAAQLGKELGEEQLAENKRQYDQNMSVARPIIDSETALANQQLNQGNDYFNYMKQYSRPTEQALFYDAMGLNPDEIAQIEALRGQETQSAQDAYNAKLTSIPKTIQQTQSVPYSEQVADYGKGAIKGSAMGAAQGVSNGQYQTGVTFGNPGGMAGMGMPMNGQATYDKINPDAYYVKGSNGYWTQAVPTFSTVNKTRDTTVDVTNPAYTAAIQQGVNTGDLPQTQALLHKLAAGAELRQQQEASDRAIADSRAGSTDAINAAIRQGLRYGASSDKIIAGAGALATQQAQQEAQAANAGRQQVKDQLYAKKLNVDSLYKGLPASSQAAYGLSLNANNAAVSNQLAPSQAYMSGIAQGNATQMQGAGLRVQGYGNILNAQTSYANSLNQNQGDGGLGPLGTIAGMAFSKWNPSDRRLKTNIRLIGTHASGLNLYEFDYIWGEHSVGVMADEVMKIKPHAVRDRGDGFMEVNYGAL